MEHDRVMKKIRKDFYQQIFDSYKNQEFYGQDLDVILIRLTEVYKKSMSKVYLQILNELLGLKLISSYKLIRESELDIPEIKTTDLILEYRDIDPGEEYEYSDQVQLLDQDFKGSDERIWSVTKVNKIKLREFINQNLKDLINIEENSDKRLITKDEIGNFYYNNSMIIFDKSTERYKIFKFIFESRPTGGLITYEELEKYIVDELDKEPEDENTLRNKRITRYLDEKNGIFKNTKLSNGRKFINDDLRGVAIIKNEKGVGYSFYNPYIY